jgi:hypothetical protein
MATAGEDEDSYANRSSRASWSSQKFHHSVTLPSALRWKTWMTFCSIRSPERSALPASSATPVLVVGEQIVDLEPEGRADLRQPFEVAEYFAGAVVGAAQLRVAEEVEGDGIGDMPRSVARSPLA